MEQLKKIASKTGFDFMKVKILMTVTVVWFCSILRLS